MSSPISSAYTSTSSNNRRNEEIESSPDSSCVLSPAPRELLNIVKEKLRPWHQEEGISPEETVRREIAAFRITQALWNHQKAVDVSDLKVSLPDFGDIKKYLPDIRSTAIKVKVRDRNQVPLGFRLSDTKQSSLLTRRCKYILRSIANSNSSLLQRRRALYSS